MTEQLSIGVLETRRNALIKQLASVGPVLQGSFCQTKVTCGNPNCRCARGEKHISRQVTKKVRNKTKGLYIPVDMVEDVQAWTGEYRRAKNLLKEISDLNEQIVRAHVSSKRARKANQDAAEQHRKKGQ
jgi:hypothetical protein